MQNIFIVNHPLSIAQDPRNNSRTSWGERVQQHNLDIHDPPLSEEGLKETQQISQWLKQNVPVDEAIQHVYSSPYLAALQTANTIVQLGKLRINVEPGLAARSHQIVTSVSKRVPYFPRIDEHYQCSVGITLAPTSSSQPTEQYPNQFLPRVVRMAQSIVDNGNSVFVTHPATSLILSAILLDIDAWRLQKIHPGEILHLRRKGRDGDFDLVCRHRLTSQVNVDSECFNFNHREAPWRWQDYVRVSSWPLLELTVLRHGQTLGNAVSVDQIPQKIQNRGDDVLTALGEEQARKLGHRKEWAACAAQFDVIFVSPLRRALKTALLAFASPEVAAARIEAGKEGPVRFKLDVQLRELNTRQRVASRPLWWRHQGTVLSQLKEEFEQWVKDLSKQRGSWVTPFRPVVVDWNSCAEMRGDRVWWDSASNSPRAACTMDYWDAHWRANGVVEKMRRLAQVKGWKKVCLVGHEGAFRSMTGVPKLPNSAALACYVAPPIVPAISKAARRSRGPPYHYGESSAQALTKAVPVNTVNLLKEHDVRDLVVVLGCSDENDALRRYRHGVKVRRQLGKYVPLLYVGSPHEQFNYLQMVSGPPQRNAGVLKEEFPFLFSDQCSTVTECNIDNALAWAAALRPDVVERHHMYVQSALQDDTKKSGLWHVLPTPENGDFAILKFPTAFKFRGPTALQEAQAVAEDNGFCAINFCPTRQVAVVRDCAVPPGPHDVSGPGVPGGPWQVWIRNYQPLTIHIITNAWHTPRSAVIARHALVSIRERALKHAVKLASMSKPVAAVTSTKDGNPISVSRWTNCRGLFRFSMASYFRKADDVTTETHLRESVVLAGRVADPRNFHSRHIASLLSTIGPELHEMGDNMRRWAVEHEKVFRQSLAKKNNGIHWKDVFDNKHRAALGKALIQAIKARNRNRANSILAKAYNRRIRIGDPNLCPLAHIPVLATGNGNTALHYCAEHGAAAIASDLVLFWGADALKHNRFNKTPLDCAKKHKDVTKALLFAMSLVNTKEKADPQAP